MPVFIREIQFPNLIDTMTPVVGTANLGDVPELVDVWCNSMNNDFLLKAFPHTPGGLGWLAKVWETAIAGERGKEEPQSRVAVARDDKGRHLSKSVLMPANGSTP